MNRNLSLGEYWKLRFSDTVPQLRVPLEDAQAYAAWRPRAEAKLRELMGRLPESVPLDPQVTDTEDAGSYIRERVVLQVERDMAMPCYVLTPKDRREPGPAILAQHGHGSGKSAICGVDLGDEAKRREIDEYNYDYAHQYALRGYVVIAPDLRSFGERLDETPGNLSACDFNYVMGVMTGYNLLALDIWDMQRAVDYLQQHPLVDPERIGMVGLSQGGTMTLFTTACEPRIKAAVCSGYFNSFWDCALVPWNMCGSQILFDMMRWFDHLELGGLVAPRPLLFENGTEDMIFPLPATVREYEKLGVLYEMLGAREKVELEICEGGHKWFGTKAYDWMDRWL